MCSCETYWARIRRIPLYPDYDSDDGDAVICRDQDGHPVRVTLPEVLLTDDKREVAVTLYEELYTRPRN